MQNFTYGLINDNVIKRKIYILQALDNGERLVVAKDIAVQLHCSKRTVINDISELKDEIPENWELIGVKTKGYILIKPMTDSVASIIDRYLTESILYKIMLEIFNNRHYTLEKWSQLLYVNKSTLGKHLKDYKRVLKRARLSLNSNSEGLQLKGEEFNIRHYYSTFFYLTQKFSNESLIPIDLKKRLFSILHENDVQMDGYFLCSIVFVFISRFFNKKYITIEMKFKPAYDNNQLKCFNEIITTIENYYNIQFPKSEREALDINLFLGSTSVHSQGGVIIDYLSNYYPEIYKSYLGLIDILVTHSTLQYENVKEVENNLIPYFYKIFILHESYFSIGYVFDSVAPCNHVLFRNYKKNEKLVSKWNLELNNGRFSKDEIVYLANYATVILNSFSESINILLLVSGNTIQQNIIYTKLAENLGGEVKIHRIPNYEAEYDLIITNQQLTNTKAPVVYISGFISENEINAIKKRIFFSE